MKQVLRFLALAVLLAAPWGGYFNQVQAQATLTVADGTATSDYVPVYGYWADNFLKCEFVYPATDLAAMDGMPISAMTFYLSSPASAAWTGTFQVFLKEVGSTTLSEWSGTADATIVYEGTLDGTGSTMTVTFDNEYDYGGGNLLVGVYQTVEEGNYKSCTFYGITATGACGQGYSSSSLESCSFTQRNFIPKTTFTYTPPAGYCYAPTALAASNITATGATLSWTAGDAETAWTVEYGTASDFAGATSQNVSTTPTLNLTGLIANTTYYVRVKAVCGVGDESNWSTTSFTTAFGIPFSESFGATAPSGWSIKSGLLNEVAGTATLSNSSTWSFGTSNNVFDNHARCNIYGNSQKWLIMPSIEMEDNVQLTFDLALTKYSGSDSPTAGQQADDKFIVLASTDNMATWTVLRKWDNARSAYVYDEITNAAAGQAVAIDLSAFDGQNVIIAFYGESTVSGGDNNLHIDNVSINYIPSCPKPTDLTLGAITASEAPLTWTAGGSEESWKVYLNGALVATVNTNSYNFTGLTANTDYTFGVAAVCGVDDESTIATVAGHTPCGTYAIPYSYGFEDLSDMTCWTVIDVPAHTTIDDGSTITGASARTGNNFFVFTYYDYPDVNPQYMTLISPELTGIANGLHVEFYYLTDGSTSYPESFRVGYSTTDNNLSSFTWVNTLTNVVAADYQLFKANYPANTKYVAVQHLSDDMNYLILDDFSFTEAPSCTEPSNLQVSNITTSGAALSWTIGGEATAWDIYVTDDDTDVPDDETTPTYAGVTSNTNCPISGLTSGTTYYVYVRSACDATTHSDWTMPTSFNTACEAISLPYQYDFEDDVLPVCWNTIGTNSGWITSFVSSTAPQHGSKHFVIQTSNNATGTQYVVLPEVDANYPLNEYEITFYSELAGSTTTGRTLAVGVMTDPTDASTFVQVGDAFTPTTSYERYKIRLNTYTGSGQYIAIKQVITSASYSADYTYIDNLEVNHIPACFEPTAFANTAVTAHGATFSWTAGNSETAWQIYVSTSASDPADDIADNASGMYAVTTNPYTIASGLDAETDYYAWVRANCGNTDGKSVWVGPVAFTTLVACPAPTGLAVGSITNHTAQVSWTNSGTNNYNVRYRTAAYTEGSVEEFNSTSLPTGWTRYSTPLTDDVLSGSTTLTSISSGWYNSSYGLGSYNWKMNIYNTSKYWIVTPAITVPAGGSLSFDAALTAYNSNNAPSSAPDANSRFVVLISNDNMATWTILRQWDNSGSTYVLNDISNSGSHFSIDISTYAGDEVKVAFYGEQAVSGPDCDLHIDNVAIGTPVAAGSWQNTSVSTNTADLTGLTPETTYDVEVQDVCGGIDGESTWSATTFTTDIPCPAPTGLAYAELKSDKVNLSWTENGTATDWIVAYKADADADFTTVAADAALIEGSNITFTLTGLTEETHYTVKVKANCEVSYPGDDVSEWTGTITFTTLEACAQPTGVAATNVTNNSATISWTGDSEFTLKYRTAAGYDGLEEEFATTSAPDGWTRYSGALNNDGTGPTTTYSSGWSFGTNKFSSIHAYMNMYSDWKYWLVTPAVTLPVGAAFSFDVAYTDYNATTAPDAGGTDDRFVVLISTNKTNWTILREWNNSDSPYVLDDIPTTFQTISDIDISAYEGQTVYIAFYGGSTESNTDNSLRIDNVAIGTPVAAGDWNNDNAGTNVGTATSHNITGLTAETKYEVQVEARCGANPTSAPYFFTTLAGITKDITANSWYAISAPVHNSSNNETLTGVNNLTDGTYDLLGYNEANATWKKPTDVLVRGKGYIYRANATKTLTFVGTCNSGNIDVTLTATDAAGTMKGWNLLGNPYPHTYALTRDCYSLSTNGTWTVHAGSYTMAVAEAVLVKSNGETFHFTETPATKAAPASTIAFTVSNDEFTDIAYARFSSEEGLPKIGHLNPEAPMLSIDGYAIANLNEGIESFPMSFSGQGSYTLTVSGNTDVTGYLHLVDRLTGRDIDLLSTPSYSFTGSPVSDRFTVKLTPDAEEGLSTSRFAIFDGNSLIVNGEGTLEVYDVMGRRLMSAEVTGSEYRIPGSDLHTGVYVLRMNGNSQKIVIK